MDTFVPFFSPLPVNAAIQCQGTEDNLAVEFTAILVLQELTIREAHTDRC